MLSRKVTNIIRFCLDELLPPIIRDNKYIMYPLFWIWFKGKNVRRFMGFKENFHALTDEEFSSYYEDYDYVANRATDLSEKTIQFILSNLGDDFEKKIVDVGAGSGYLLNRIQEKGYSNLLGIDLVPHSNYSTIRIVSENIENIQYPDKSCDIVICNHTLEHVLNLPKAIQELKRITAEKLIITVPRQRYYKYTFDLHVHFFPQISYLLKYIDIPMENIYYKNIGGDWTVICKMN